ncbi:hypothetical protein [Streptomyces ipomoeae]|uniref:hypothetical protein n=1 Tax=Streptomyces ipomoeae TaxID=103232 RepID=UPI0011471ACE|nr:hypothetical protein [Streptomyces ipomoeae]TQE33172.1 hypothetical protein Sipo7851_22020 [Streptomyces ipomoeae]
MTRRGAGRFPLTPGRPFVPQRPNGRWGYTCCCAGQSRTGALSADEHNRASHAEALRAALIHVQVTHLTPEQREVLALEVLFALPPASRP